VPAQPAGVTYVQLAGGWATVWREGRRKVVDWGSHDYGVQRAGPPSGVTYVEFSTFGNHTLARRSDGRVVGWGPNLMGQCNAPTPPAGLSFVEIAAGGYHGLARRNDGQVFAWGRQNEGQCTVPVLPPGLAYVEIAAGSYHSLARRSDGSVVAWGYNQHGQCNVPPPPVGLAYVEIAAGYDHSLGRLSDGSVIGWEAISSASATCRAARRPRYVQIAAGDTTASRGGATLGRRLGLQRMG
jgi:hypothetical protein